MTPTRQASHTRSFPRQSHVLLSSFLIRHRSPGHYFVRKQDTNHHPLALVFSASDKHSVQPSLQTTGPWYCSKRQVAIQALPTSSSSLLCAAVKRSLSPPVPPQDCRPQTTTANTSKTNTINKGLATSVRRSH